METSDMSRKTLCVIACAWLCCVVASAQQWEPTETEKSYGRAHDILRASVEAHGAGERVEALSNISLIFRGTHTLPLQNLKPDFTKNPLPKEGRLIFDGKGGRISLEEKIDRPGVYTGWHRLITDGSKAFDLNLRSKQFRPTSPAALTQRATNLLPHLVLSEALKRPATWRWLGDAVYQNRRHHLICFSNGAGQQLTLYIDADSKRLTKFEVLAALSAYGDRTLEYVFGGYQLTGGVLLPGERLTKLSGVTTEALSYSDVRLNGELGPQLFAAPPDFVLRDDNAQRARRDISVTEVARDVYTVENAGGTDLKVMFVAFDEFVLVAGAPHGISDPVIEKIKETVHGKPIRYVVPTHHHSDHAGGLRSYIAEGITIITTPGNRGFVEDLSTAKFTLSPDRLARSPRAPVIELVRDKRRVIADAAHRVELYDIGPTPHADEMIVVYLPRERIIYQGDLLELDDDDPITELTANEVTVYFHRKIQELDLKVEKIIGTEGRTATLEDLRKAVALRK
jgi:glyoxylase-like metal-dependent hydrolase (beta-lactamase superfamily II)